MAARSSSTFPSSSSEDMFSIRKLLYSNSDDYSDNDNEANGTGYENGGGSDSFQPETENEIENSRWQTKTGKRRTSWAETEINIASVETVKRTRVESANDSNPDRVRDTTEEEEEEQGSIPNPTENSHHQQTCIAYIRGTHRKITSCNPIQVNHDIIAAFGSVKRIERRGESLKVFCLSPKQRDLILKCKQIGSIEVTTSLPNAEVRRQRTGTADLSASPHFERVVITGVPTDIQDADVIEATGADELERIRRTDTNTGVKVPTLAVILKYSCDINQIPRMVRIGYMVFKTRIYIPRVTRCYKCQKFGHIAKNCFRTFQVCSICSGDHSFNQCPNSAVKKCANCSGPHSANDRECPRYIVARHVTHHAAVNRMSYKDALIKIRKEAKSSQKTPQTASDPNTAGIIYVSPPPSVEKVSIGTQTEVEEIGNDASSKTEPDSFVDFLQLLALILQLSEDRETRRSDVTKAVLSFAMQRLKQPKDVVLKTVENYLTVDPSKKSTQVSVKSQTGNGNQKKSANQTAATTSTSSTSTVAKGVSKPKRNVFKKADSK